MLKCKDCGHIFEEGEEKVWQEKIGEHFGAPAYIGGSCCPVCEGDYEETSQCPICKGHFLEAELDHGYCEECMSEKEFDIAFFKGLCDERNIKADIKINDFLGFIFSPEEIEEILWEKAKFISKKYPQEISCKEYMTFAKDYLED